MLPRPLISAITDRHRLDARDEEACARLTEWAAAIAHAGVDIIQIRERGLTDARLARLARDVVAAAAGSAAAVVVNARTDIALAAGAAGLHLPSAEPPAMTIRRITPEGFLIGRSVHADDDAAAVERQRGCDYLTFGTVFPSTSKPGQAAAGVAALRHACAASTLPVQAIGGISLSRASEVARAGAAGVAAISLFLDPWRPGQPASGRDARLAGLISGLRECFAAAGQQPDLADFPGTS